MDRYPRARYRARTIRWPRATRDHPFTTVGRVPPRVTRDARAASPFRKMRDIN